MDPVLDQRIVKGRFLQKMIVDWLVAEIEPAFDQETLELLPKYRKPASMALSWPSAELLHVVESIDRYEPLRASRIPWFTKSVVRMTIPWPGVPSAEIRP